MRLENIYKSNINRPINGVIKVAQNDEESIEQELREYIITRELRRHFTTFLNNYEQSLTQATDKIGVWISGFFGSGKSHFLKMLSYLLENNIVAGKHAVDYFSDKFDDPMMFAQLEACVKVPTETILFNIDSKSPLTKDKTAILRVFAKVFYEHRGFYGTDLKVAKLEAFVEKEGKLNEFKNVFERINGDSWESSREAYAFFEDDIVQTLTEVLDMSETSARNWFNSDEEASLSIEKLVEEIKAYIDSKGKDFRLMFMIDEVGQYIGSDSDLMLNLQTIVEEIGTKCIGRVWVMVTSQEAIDSITKISGDDFSKIQGRFNTRLSLSSSSVDEVIQKRILAKNDDAKKMLSLSYEKNHSTLRNLLEFDKDSSAHDMKGYAGEGEFIATYPFVPYQFRLMQNVLAQIRKHGNSGKHLSGGERSMLSGFQDAAREINDKDENALVPFYMFYDTVHTFLESTIRRVIDRCQQAAENNDYIQPYDVNVLKLLYLIRYVECDVKANVANILILMADDIRTDKYSKRVEIQQSLDRLVSQNYVSRNGDTYTFLTDDEQDIAREINNTMIDSAQITNAISNIIFEDIYPSKKFKYGKYDFAYDRMIDETVVGQSGSSIRLHFITVASEDYSTDDSRYIMKSDVGNEAIIVLSENYPYFNELENAMKIRKYVKGKNIAQLPEAIQSIIRRQQQTATNYEDHAKELINSSIAEGRIYAAGDKLSLKIAGVKDRIEQALSTLVESVYTKLGFVSQSYDSDADIIEFLTGENKQVILDIDMAPNSEAVKEMLQYLEMQRMKNLPTSMGDIHKRFSAIPYGWREIDIAGVTAELISLQKITVKYAGSVIQPSDKKITDYLRRKSEIDKVSVSLRIVADPKLIKSSREIMCEYFNVGATEIPSDEDKLIAAITDRFTQQLEDFNALIAKEYAVEKYPGKSLVEEGIELCKELLSQKKDNIALLKKLVEMEDDLLDHNNEISDVINFFGAQREIFDRAIGTVSFAEMEKEYLQAEDEVKRNISTIKTILAMPKPYKRINELPALTHQIYSIHNQLLTEKQNEVEAEIRAAMGEIHQTANEKQKDIVTAADKALQEKITNTKSAVNMTSLDAMKMQIANIRQQYIKQLVVNDTPDVKTATLNRSLVCHTMKLKNEEDVDRYLAEVKEKLMQKLEGNDILHII